MISRRGFLTGCLSLGSLGVTGCGVPSQLHRQRWFLFGTLVDVTVAHPDSNVVAAGMQDLAAVLGDMHRNLHAWRPGMLLDVNRALSRGETIPVQSSMASLISELQDTYRLSRGVFNPALGQLVGFWGFHNDVPAAGPPPSSQQIESLLADAPTPLDLQVRGGTLSSRNPRVQLDLGGYGKGYALDAGIAALRQAGIRNAIVNAGGDLNVAGADDGQAWRIGIRHPQGRGAIAWLETTGGEAVYTSGNYERYFDYEGRRYAHILDPRNGMPAQDIVSATVINDNGAWADAGATALSVAGPGQWQSVAESLGLRQVMVVTRSGRVELTRSMSERLYLSETVRKKVVVV